MTSVADYRTNVETTLAYLDTILPAGSHVVFTGVLGVCGIGEVTEPGDSSGTLVLRANDQLVAVPPPHSPQKKHARVSQGRDVLRPDAYRAVAAVWDELPAGVELGVGPRHRPKG